MLLTEQARVDRIQIPARCKPRIKPKAFKGPNAHKAAYIVGRFLCAAAGHEISQTWCREYGVDFSNSQHETENDLGGFLVPEEMEDAIIDLREEYGVFRQNAKITPMASDTKSLPRRTGGVTAYFGGDGTTLKESQKGWDQVKLVAKKLYAFIRYSNEISEDAIINIGDDLTQEIAYAFAVKEDQCGFSGDGTSTYDGIVGLGNIIGAGSTFIAASGHVGFETLSLSDFEQMLGLLPTYCLSPKWYISKYGYSASMLRLMTYAGGNTASDIQKGDGGEKVFLGHPVVIAQGLNKTVGMDLNQPKVLFGDLSLAATLGDRRGLSLDISTER